MPSTLKMGAVGSSETLVNKYETHWTTIYAPKPLHLPCIPLNTRIRYIEKLKLKYVLGDFLFMFRLCALKMEAVKMYETSAIQPKPTSTRLHLPVTEFTFVLF